MAGYIHIRKGTGISLSTSAIEVLAIHLREAAAQDDQSVIAAACESLDEGFWHIGLESLSSSEFIRFLDVFDRAKSKMSGKTNLAGFKPTWDEIAKALRSDSRVAGSGAK